MDETDGPVWFPVESIKAAKPQGNMVWVDDDAGADHNFSISKAFAGAGDAQRYEILNNSLCYYVLNSLPIVSIRVGKNLQISSHSKLIGSELATSTYPAIISAKGLSKRDQDDVHHFGRDLLSTILDEDTIAIAFPSNRIVTYQRNGGSRILAKAEVNSEIKDPSFRWID
jgi:hypothetical protein